MEKYRAIPQGYMTVGQVAKKMGVTVRTMQYYDKAGLLSPSSESEGGRRLYTDADVIKLYQILSLKHIGFSLEAIKNRLVSLNTPADVAGALAEQAAAIREKIESLSESLIVIEALQAETVQMQSVDFQKYADIIANLQMKNEYYWLIKYFDSRTLDHIRNHFDMDSGLAFMDTFHRLCDEVLLLQRAGVPPESEQGQQLAQAFWNMVMEFVDGDMSMLPKLMETASFGGADSEWQQKLTVVIQFIEPALDVYFTRLGVNPFEEGAK